MLSHIRKYLSQNKENPTPFQNIIRMLPNPNLHCVLCFDVITKVIIISLTKIICDLMQHKIKIMTHTFTTPYVMKVISEAFYEQVTLFNRGLILIRY